MKRLFFLFLIASLGCNASIIPLGLSFFIVGPTTITTPGTYILARDIVGTITIAANNVELDLNNHSINANSQPYGIFVDTCQHISIYNGSVSRGSNGIFITNSTNVTLFGIACTFNDIGLALHNAVDCVVEQCGYSDNFSNGIVLVQASHNNSICNCNCNRNGAQGIMLNGATKNSIHANRCNDNGYFGILLVAASSFNEISNCTAQNNKGSGIRASVFSVHNTFANNTCAENTNGIDIDSSSNSALLQENICNDNQIGFRIIANDCCITHNFAHGNDRGFYNTGTNNTFFSNKAQNNGINYGGVNLIATYDISNGTFAREPVLHSNIAVVP